MTLLVIGLGGGTLPPTAGIIIGWLTDNLVSGLVIGVLAGMLILGIFAVKAARIAGAASHLIEASTAEGATPQAAPADTDSRQALEAQIERLEKDNSRLQQRLNDFDGDRLRFKTLLHNAWDEGHRLRESNPSKEEAREWAARVRQLVEDALSPEWADNVFKDDPSFRSAIFDSTPEQMWIESRVNRLQDQLIRLVESKDYIPFRSGFDPHDYNLETLTPKSGVQEFRTWMCSRERR